MEMVSSPGWQIQPSARSSAISFGMITGIHAVRLARQWSGTPQFPRRLLLQLARNLWLLVRLRMRRFRPASLRATVCFIAKHAPQPLTYGPLHGCPQVRVLIFFM